MLPMLVIDAWYSVGAALVLVLAGMGRFSWSDWPVYVVALCAQLLFDATAAVTWSWAVEGISPRVQLPLLCWTYVIDAALAPLGLVIAASSVQRPGLVLFALSPAAMLIFFARERKHRLTQTQALTTAYRGTALLLGELVEADDHYTGTHSRDVVDLSLAVAEAVGLDSARRRDVEFAALLHDVGKMRVSKDIINKRGPLDPAEWEVIRRHTIDGELMLRRVGGALSNVGRIVRSSHERFDGAGYPDGLAGEAIPLEARIVSVCDSYSAMTTDRPYRAAMSVGQAVAELHRCAGSQFDPDVVLALTQVLGTSSEAVPEPAQTPQASSLRAVFSG
jgi:putative nucleotidyltransferase with HDIG domain